MKNMNAYISLKWPVCSARSFYYMVPQPTYLLSLPHIMQTPNILVCKILENMGSIFTAIYCIKCISHIFTCMILYNMATLLKSLLQASVYNANSILPSSTQCPHALTFFKRFVLKISLHLHPLWLVLVT